MQKHAREEAEKEHQKVVYERKPSGKWSAFAFFHYLVLQDSEKVMFDTEKEIKEYALELRDRYAARIYNKYLESNDRLSE